MHFTVHLKSPVWTPPEAEVHRILFTTCLQDYELLWLASVMDVQFIVKVGIPKIVWWLKMSSLPEKLYAGAVQDGVKLKVIRNPKYKWFVSEQFLNDSWFPPYCNGALLFFI